MHSTTELYLPLSYTSHAHFVEVKTEAQGWFFLSDKSASLLYVNPNIAKLRQKIEGSEPFVADRTTIHPHTRVNTEESFLFLFVLFDWFFFF